MTGLVSCFNCNDSVMESSALIAISGKTGQQAYACSAACRDAIEAK